MSMNFTPVSVTTAASGHTNHASQWLTRFSDLLLFPNPHTYACFLVGHTRFSDQLCPNIHASFLVGQMPRQDFLTHLQCLSKAAKHKDTLHHTIKSLSHKPQELSSYSSMPSLFATLPSQSATGTVWDKILVWIGLWSELAQPFLCPNALLTASYVPCSLIHFDKDWF